ncbi:MAG: OmpA family protein [Akkermansiaceae bacterium]|nr:OmpA family protein [Akkermansiaceae bacterium]
MILIMVVVLAVINLSGKNPANPDLNSDDPVMASLKADLEARRSELNRQRIAMGWPPLDGGSEPIEDIAQLAAIAENDVPDGDLTLIIGYASKTGDSVANERLSSDRATAAAQQFSAMKRPGQKVQAVYLGQTDRFSSSIPVRNQLCEIWRIRKK